jgi:pantothenate synthetase
MTFIDATLKKYFPENEVIVSSVIVNKEPEYFTEEIDEPKSMEEQINSCKSATVLKAVYEPIIKKMPELEKIYKSKLKELSK